MELEDKDLSFNYRTHCDPRLNYEQSLGQLLRWKCPKVYELILYFFFSQTSRFCSPTTSSQREEVKDRMISCFQVCVVEEMTVKNKLDLYARMANGVIFLTLALFSRGKCQLGSTAKTNF